MSVAEEIQQLVNQQAPEVQQIAAVVRQEIRTYGLLYNEDVSLKLKTIYFKHNGVVAALSVHKAHANLHFYKGAQLPDPDGELQGQGDQLRHIRITRASDIDRDLLEHYFRAAYALNER
jgi:hypothetical protein